MKGEMAWLFKKKITLPSPLMEKDWREIKWGDKEKELKALKSKVQELQLGSPDVQHLRILMYGPPGAGKSSFVNIDSIFQDRMTSAATVDAATDVSFTKMFQIHKIRKGKSGQLPFVICDVMGLETGDSGGVHPEDLMNTLKGHVKNGYKLNPRSPISDSDPHYNSCPSLGDRIHCLVGIVPADKVSLIDDDFFKKMREIRIKASELKIPEVAVLTKIHLSTEARRSKRICRSSVINLEFP
ncbi:interferon-induced protein 44-like isoform X2 [Alosa sapidissima]|uniref:interferon-induced protein 44-like isoform X2 n=1 Tax=Alosa sapidissima TaxID=34773 RepID=UPI001C08FF8F|nr:interferon-induced protein 44-like isoform X2 [Alosa sapidissima]